MTTTLTRLDPAVATTIAQIKKAHAKAKAPGTFLALLPESGQYYVLTNHGAVKHRYVESGGKVHIHYQGRKFS